VIFLIISPNIDTYFKMYNFNTGSVITVYDKAVCEKTHKIYSTDRTNETLLTHSVRGNTHYHKKNPCGTIWQYSHPVIPSEEVINYNVVTTWVKNNFFFKSSSLLKYIRLTMDMISSAAEKTGWLHKMAAIKVCTCTTIGGYIVTPGLRNSWF